MSLFSADDILSGDGTAPKYATLADGSGAARCYSAGEHGALAQAVGALDKSTHIASCGAFSMHQLAFYVAALIGPAKLYATTWAINEEVVSQLLRATQDGLLEEVTFLFDWRVRKYKPKAYALASQHFATHVVSLHAKVCVLEGRTRSVAVVGSANWTRNSKIEAYYVCIDADVANFWKKFIDERVHQRTAEGGGAVRGAML
jgi:hypothetical protein